jgi:hypothetical protein
MVHGDVVLRNMGNLTSLTGLGALTTIGGGLALQRLSALQSTTALANLTAVGGCYCVCVFVLCDTDLCTFTWVCRGVVEKECVSAPSNQSTIVT